MSDLLMGHYDNVYIIQFRNSHGIHIWIIPQNFNLTNQHVQFTFEAFWYRIYHTIQNSHGIRIWKIPQNFNLTKFEISVPKLPVRYYDIAYIILFLKFRNSQGILFMEFPQNCWLIWQNSKSTCPSYLSGLIILLISYDF